MRVGLTAAALLALAACRAETAAAPVAKPVLYVLTSLPLLFDEGFGIAPANGEAAVFLREHYRIKPIDLPSQLPPGATLLAAQPRALPAAELVALDAWVRRGGRLVLLADPMLEWPSKRAFGDRLRPPVAYADTGLLAHWGLRLDAPDERGLKTVRSGDLETTFLSPGKFAKVGGNCRLDGQDVVAVCTLEKGRAIIFADADWLDVEAIKASGRHPRDNLFSLAVVLSALGVTANL